jgi:uncharacterized protein (TIGR03437 family)
VNFVVPPGSSAGTAQITVTQNGSIAASASTVVASGLMTIAATSPSIFTVNSSGAGLVNGLVQNGLSFSLTFNPGTLAPVPIDVSTGTAYLTVAATGAPLGSASVATALVGTTPVPVLAVYSYAPFTGLEGIILGPFPASLQGSGTQTIALSIGGVPANPVTIQIQ